MSTQALLTPIKMGSLELRNRIVVAPLTRVRAANTAYRLCVARSQRPRAA